MDSLTRRQALVLAGASTASVAGCLGGSSNSIGSPDTSYACDLSGSEPTPTVDLETIGSPHSLQILSPPCPDEAESSLIEDHTLICHQQLYPILYCLLLVFPQFRHKIAHDPLCGRPLRERR